MSIFYKLGLSVTIYLFSTLAVAANDQVPKDRTITEISVYDYSIVVIFEPSFANTQGCVEGATNVGQIDITNAQGKELYAAVLSAAAAKLKVGFGLGGCYQNSPKIYRVDIKYL